MAVGMLKEFPEGVPGVKWGNQKAEHLGRLVTAHSSDNPLRAELTISKPT